MEEPGGNMYQWYILLQARGGVSVQISTHVVYEKMEMKIDHKLYQYLLTILKITKILSL